MEIKAKLKKPCTDLERMEFLSANNDVLGYEIRETEKYLQAWGSTKEELEEQEKERVSNLSLTHSDVERAIYEAKGMDFDDVFEKVKNSEITGLDAKRLKIELKSNIFVRKHPYIDIVGQILGYTPEDMDFLFINKSLPIKEEEV